MNMYNKFAKAAVAAALITMAYTAKADGSDSGASAFEPGFPAMVYLTGPASGSDGGATPPLSQQKLGPVAMVSITAPNPIADGEATGDIRMAHNQDESRQVADAGFASGTR
ncbi:MAG: hypothetical protein ACHQIO_01570 [Nevskiales bacterium]